MNTKTLKTCSILCAALMLALILCHWMPFWTVNGESVSLQQYVWNCTEHGEVTKYLESVDAQFNINDFVTLPLFIFIAAVVGAVFCLAKPRSLWASLLPAISGLLGVIAYLTDPALQAGSLWVLHLLLCVAILAVAVVTFYFRSKAKGEE